MRATQLCGRPQGYAPTSLLAFKAQLCGRTAVRPYVFSVPYSLFPIPFFYIMSRIPKKSSEILQNFFIWLQQLDPKPSEIPQLQASLEELKSRLDPLEDKPTELAKVIQNWCKASQISFSDDRWRQVRATWIDNNPEAFRQTTPGEEATTVGNKAIIYQAIDEVQKGFEEKPQESEDE